MSSPFNDKIVSIHHAYRSYVDEAYYRRYLGESDEKSDDNNYPVKVVAVQVGWLLHDAETGRRFLAELYRSENLELYEVETVQILVEYLYKRFKSEVKKWRLPFHLFYLASFLVTIIIHEWNVHEDLYPQGWADGE